MTNEAVKIAEIINQDLTEPIERMKDKILETPLREEYSHLRSSYMHFLKNCFDGDLNSDYAASQHEGFKNHLHTLKERLESGNFAPESEEYEEEYNPVEPHLFTAKEYQEAHMVTDEPKEMTDEQQWYAIKEGIDNDKLNISAYQEAVSNHPKFGEESLTIELENAPPEIRKLLYETFPHLFGSPADVNLPEDNPGLTHAEKENIIAGVDVPHEDHTEPEDLSKVTEAQNEVYKKLGITPKNEQVINDILKYNKQAQEEIAAMKKEQEEYEAILQHVDKSSVEISGEVIDTNEDPYQS